MFVFCNSRLISKFLYADERLFDPAVRLLFIVDFSVS